MTPAPSGRDGVPVNILRSGLVNEGEHFNLPVLKCFAMCIVDRSSTMFTVHQAGSRVRLTVKHYPYSLILDGRCRF